MGLTVSNFSLNRASHKGGFFTFEGFFGGAGGLVTSGSLNFRIASLTSDCFLVTAGSGFVLACNFSNAVTCFKLEVGFGFPTYLQLFVPRTPVFLNAFSASVASPANFFGIKGAFAPTELSWQPRTCSCCSPEVPVLLLNLP